MNGSENLQLWVDEAERRLAELHAGKALEYPAEEVLQSVRTALRSLQNTDHLVDVTDMV